MGKLIKVTSLATTDQIKSDFVVYALFNSVQCRYLDRTIYNEFKQREMFFVQEAAVMLKEHELNMNEFIKFFNTNDKIPEMFRPLIENITHKTIDAKKRRHRKNRLVIVEKKYKQLKHKCYMPSFHKYFEEFNELTHKTELEDVLEIHKITFRQSTISFLKQKDMTADTTNMTHFKKTWEEEKQKFMQNVINFFVEYTKQQGEDYDDYLENWASRLLRETQ